MSTSISHEAKRVQVHTDYAVNLANVHHEHALACLLWRTIQDDLVEFLRPGTEGLGPIEHFGSRTRLLDLLEAESTPGDEDRTQAQEPWLRGTQAAEKLGPTEPEPRRILPSPGVKEIRVPPPDPKRREREREHFLGGGNPRRPSEN